MIRIAVGTSLSKKLRLATENVKLCDDQGRMLGQFTPTQQVELCDESGCTLGFFLPVSVYEELVRIADQCPYSEDELQQFEAETGGTTLSEFWRGLKGA